jgi:hypothetical protein
MMVGREKGWWDNFYWCKNMDDLRVGLDMGPVVIGVKWLEGMYDTQPNGVVDLSGGEVGKHCLTLTGYTPHHAAADRVVRWRNSWGTTYGRNGSGYIRWRDLQSILFDDGNEAAVPMGRKLGRA